MRRFVISSLVALLAASLPTGALATPRDTTIRTIRDLDDDNLLEYAPGEDYEVIGTATAGTDTFVVQGDDSFRPPRQGSILNFLHLSDFQMVDEESPGRVELLDKTQRGPFTPFSSAYRPQETLTTQVTESMVRAARNATSPITSEQLELAILTGDNADSQQYNETRWFVDILDGTAGNRDASQLPDESQMPPELDPTGITLEDKIDPNSGVEGTCDLEPDALYDGVQGGGEHGYYDPDRSGPNTDGQGYSPNRLENQAETGNPIQGDVTVRDFPDLFEAAQKPFEAIGLDMPWYSAFGNHDALVQGNSPDAYVGPFGGLYAQEGEQSNPVYQNVVTGCFKPKDDLTPPEGPPGDPVTFFGETFNTQVVPQDMRRCYLAKDEAGTGVPPPPGPCGQAGWIEQHFLSTGAPVGHGFAPGPCTVDEPAAQEVEDDPNDPTDEVCLGYGRPQEADNHNDGYYSFAPRQGLRYVVLDTVTDECGSIFCSEGSVDDTQFEWLKEQLELATAAGEYVMAFSHHTLRTTRFPSTDPSEYEDPADGDNDPTTGGVHYGLRVEHEDDQLRPGPANPTSVETLEDLFCDFPNLIAHVAGHEHENYVKNYDCDGAPLGSAAGPSAAAGGFWHISTAAHIDWPQQARMIELVDNEDATEGDPGTMSLVLTILDHDGPPNPGGAKPDYIPNGNAGEQVLRLASIAREISYNDYQHNRGSLGGSPTDRNVIIQLDRPWPYPSDEPGN